jgi:hypothetical protein
MESHDSPTKSVDIKYSALPISQTRGLSARYKTINVKIRYKTNNVMAISILP